MLVKLWLSVICWVIVVHGSCFGDLNGVTYEIPEDFVYLSDFDKSILQDIRYYTNHNFMGHPVIGYDYPECILTTVAAEALSQVQSYLLPLNMSLKVYDCYRPQQSVNSFFLWSQNSDYLMKKEFYPTTEKVDLFPDGYIASRSGHSRGSTIDLTIVPVPTPVQPEYIRHQPLYPCIAPQKDRFPDNSLNFGTGYDCFSKLAHSAAPEGIIGQEAYQNRQFLNNTMFEFGFINYLNEWWHFTLIDEPYPDTYFDFVIGCNNTSFDVY